MVTLDADVAMRLKETARERGVSFNEALNSAVRAGLAAGREARPYRTPSRPLGLRPGINLDKALEITGELLDKALEIMGELEDEEILRKPTSPGSPASAG
jgi:hypothetical protein